MRTRIKAMVAAVIASAALGGALATPASADPPLYDYFFECVASGFSTSLQDDSATSKETHHAQNAVRQACREVDGTFTSTIERV
jgi:hypothetical protein